MSAARAREAHRVACGKAMALLSTSSRLIPGAGFSPDSSPHLGV